MFDTVLLWLGLKLWSDTQCDRFNLFDFSEICASGPQKVQNIFNVFLVTLKKGGVHASM